MIAFVTLLLGLVVGREPVVLLVVDPAVASVEILLDGRAVGELSGKPWALSVDFGPELEPHELAAVAYDTGGRELDRVRQWVNVPRRLAEAGAVLEGGDRGRGVKARLTWASVVAAEPESIKVWFDGKAIAVDDPRHIPLPNHDPKKLHFLRAELDFADNVSSVLEFAFGGTYADQVAIDLTAVPIEIDPGVRTPTVEQLQGSFSEGRRPLKVVAIDEGPAEVLLVRDENVRGILSRIGRTSHRALRRRAVTGNVSRDPARQPLRFRMTLTGRHQLRFLWPFSRRGQLDFDLLSPSRPYSAADGGLYWLLTDVTAPSVTAPDLDAGRQRLADAVAVAGLLAAGRNRRRAVVLILGTDSEDASLFAPAAVRGFLGRLQAPLIVWSPGAGGDGEGTGVPPSSWGPVVDVSSLKKLERAVADLDRALGRQRIVWLDGVERPPDVGLDGARNGFRLLR